ncbi:multidrug effflux MFS transporter [Paraburkholderia caribensis]|uniref:multidrug effflux MFS transporter n=1 Tax=Paraburkholderia caribensis TaxID=75105 RepID=UPI001CB5FF54|nr:multidrug effflux MFS transporter [Paraburkholderia caribensis]CAG9257367.1 Bcr/CflA family efflux transporter [Paraburkholderia caribensis]
MPTDHRSTTAAKHDAQHHRVRTLLILSTLMAFASISTDLYLPALPAMADALRADPGTLQLTISGYLIGFSLGQLLWGPVSDRHGRRLPVAIGLVLFIFGSAGCAISQDAHTLIGWRVLQAVGACASVVISRAMVRDLYSGARAAQMMSTLMTVMAIAPLIGPSVGSLILHVASWRAIFWVLVAVGIATLAGLYCLPETLPRERRIRAPLGNSLAGYASLLRNRSVLGYSVSVGFFYGGIFAYVAGTPFAYITYHHVSPQHYGVLFAAGIVGIMITNQVNARLVLRFGGDRLMRFGAIVAGLMGALLAFDAGSGWGGLTGLVLPLFLFVSTNGFINANAITGALGACPERAGAVSALIGSIQYGAGIAGSALIGFFADGTPRPMAYVIALMGIGCWLSTRLLVPRESVRQTCANTIA